MSELFTRPPSQTLPLHSSMPSKRPTWSWLLELLSSHAHVLIAAAPICILSRMTILKFKRNRKHTNEAFLTPYPSAVLRSVPPPSLKMCLHPFSISYSSHFSLFLPLPVKVICHSESGHFVSIIILNPDTPIPTSSVPTPLVRLLA